MRKNKLEQLAQEYINKANDACCILLEGLSLNSKNELIQYRQIKPSGEFYLRGYNNYTFHGRGCRFSNKNFKIDWDFGYGDLWCGLDPWKLSDFLKDNNLIENCYDGYEIEEIFKQLIIEGKMKNILGLYYFI